ncbi:TPA: hypothetical protein MIM69_28960 [Klebsiella variicola]|nr:hypothetical protein [Klebsiella pneumoniae]HBX9979048.1 hypothetical protein [Klebsiella variicola]
MSEIMDLVVIEKKNAMAVFTNNDQLDPLIEAIEKEARSLAEEKRKADEQARREADVKHRKAVGVEVVKALVANTSLTREQAIEVLTAVKDGRIPHTGISY